ncbi:MAG: DUF624 domain-containing protein [Lachnospiraceae bacterium]|nr:DUF624 domain-containing protein [Lachnospiraceae bacterium]
MNGFFKYDGPFISMMTRVANLMIVSILWVLTCLPVITVIPASAALFHTVIKVVRDKGKGVVKDFFVSFVSNLKQGIILNLIFGVIGALLAYSIYIALQFKSIPGFLYLGFGIFLAIVWCMTVLYMAPVLSRFEGSIGQLIRIALYLPTKNMLLTFVMLILFAIIVFLTDFYPIVLMFTPGVYADLVAGSIDKKMVAFAEGN